MPYCRYLRKSRAEIDSEKNGEIDPLARHEAILFELAKRQNLEVAETYREIVSGDTIAARPVMQKLLYEVEQGLWEGVLVMEVERLARGSTLDQGIVAQTFKLTNTKIITPSKTYDPNNEFDEEYFEFGLFMSRREYKAINRRMARGREAAVKEGKYIGTYPPYGYNKIWRDKSPTLEINPEQAEIVKLIYEFYTRDNNRLGYNSIANTLNNMGVPAMRSNEWIASSVKAIMKNPVYIGKLRWHYKKEVKNIINGEVKVTTVTNKEGEYIIADGIHEPIIDIETWEKAQNHVKQIASSPAPLIHGLKNPFAGLIICGVCGKKMVKKPYINKTDQLYCYNRNCENKGVGFKLVEQEILLSLQNWLDDFKLKNKSQDNKNKSDSKNQISVKEKQLDKAFKDKSVLEKQLDKTYSLLEQGIYDTNEFLDRSTVLKKSISELDKKLKGLRQEINTENININNTENYIPKVESILQAYNNISDIEQKNRLMKEILSKIIYTREKRNYRDGINHKFEIKIIPKIR